MSHCGCPHPHGRLTPDIRTRLRETESKTLQPQETLDDKTCSCLVAAAPQAEPVNRAQGERVLVKPVEERNQLQLTDG